MAKSREWSTSLTRYICVYHLSEEISVRFNHNFPDTASFHCTLACNAKESRSLGPLKSKNEVQRIFTQEFWVHLPKDTYECVLSFRIPETFEAHGSNLISAWDFSVVPSSVNLGWMCELQDLHPPPLEAPPPSFLSGNEVQGKYEIQYALEVRMPYPEDVDPSTMKPEILPFVLKAGEPPREPCLSELSGLQDTIGLPLAKIPSLLNPRSLNSSIRLHEAEARFNSLPDIPLSMEFQLPERIIQRTPMQIPYKVKVPPSMPLKSNTAIVCKLTVEFTQYLQFDLSSSPNPQDEGRRIGRKSFTFSLHALLTRQDTSGQTAAFEATPKELIPTFRVGNRSSVPPEERFKARIACYCKARIKYVSTLYDSGIAESCADLGNGEFEWDLIVLPVYYASFVDLGIFTPIEHQDRDLANRQGLHLPSSCTVQRRQMDYAEDPPDYDTLSIQSDQTLPRYEDQ